MARNDPQILLRLPIETKESIQKEATESGRSMNAELVHRLEKSLLSATTPTGELSAADAKKLAKHALEDGSAALVAKCLEEVSRMARQGLAEVTVDTCFDAISAEMEEKILQPAKARLEGLGYTVTFDSGNVVLAF
ncbi:Arc family DNA-binding protein [Enterovibrio baiacu]|uniref:Arc family DNA-binding protein n=1 Tax=Enterovibrio baiacu TaxID=2491023 RepID=UPI0010139434|nr:Arc family DNA-binding protein [Enterovibrio baiacu]MBE1275643.1 Arc family DNA-binding protein [Enterovibrio baiacu]